MSERGQEKMEITKDDNKIYDEQKMMREKDEINKQKRLRRKKLTKVDEKRNEQNKKEIK